MLLIDLGVPRNIEDQVRDIENAYLFSIEDMEKVTQENLGERTSEAKKAHTLIVNKAALVDSNISLKNIRSKAYLALTSIAKSLSDESIERISQSQDPLQEVQQIHQLSDDQLQCLSTQTPHAILSMIKEIRSAR